MEKIDHKIVLKTYEYFSKNNNLTICKIALIKDLKIKESQLINCLERLRKIGLLESAIVTGENLPYQLSEKGISYAEKNTKSFFEKLFSIKIVIWVFKLISFVVVYLLGLYTDEIKTYISTFFKP